MPIATVSLFPKFNVSQITQIIISGNKRPNLDPVELLLDPVELLFPQDCQQKDNCEADLAAKSPEEQASTSTVAGSAGLVAARVELMKAQEQIEEQRKEIENFKKQNDKKLLADAQNRASLTEQISRSEHESVVAALEAKIKELNEKDVSKQATIDRLNEKILNARVIQQGSKPSTSSGTIEKSEPVPATPSMEDDFTPRKYNYLHCPSCKWAFVKKSSLIRHQAQRICHLVPQNLTTHIKIVKCTICINTFANRASLTKHVLQHHSDVLPTTILLTCEKCKFKCTKQKLMEHFKSCLFCISVEIPLNGKK